MRSCKKQTNKQKNQPKKKSKTTTELIQSLTFKGNAKFPLMNFDKGPALQRKTGFC